MRFRSSYIDERSYRKPLRIIRFAHGEDRFQRPVGREREASGVDQEFASYVEEDQEEVQSAETKDDIDFGNGSLLLEVLQGWVFGQLPAYG